MITEVYETIKGIVEMESSLQWIKLKLREIEAYDSHNQFWNMFSVRLINHHFGHMKLH